MGRQTPEKNTDQEAANLANRTLRTSEVLFLETLEIAKRRSNNERELENWRENANPLAYS